MLASVDERLRMFGRKMIERKLRERLVNAAMTRFNKDCFIDPQHATDHKEHYEDLIRSYYSMTFTDKEILVELDRIHV